MKIKILTMNSVYFFKAMIFMQNTSYLKQNSAYKKAEQAPAHSAFCHDNLTRLLFQPLHYSYRFH